MPFVTLKTNHLSSAETKAVEDACKKAWVETGKGFPGKFLAEDVGGVVVAASFGVLLLNHSELEFYYVDRGASFKEKLNVELRRELANVLSSSSTILLCPTKAERWFADPTWAIQVKQEGLGPQIG